MNVTIVLADNGDTEPEVWVFRDLDDAVAFAHARGGESGNGITVMNDMPVLAHGEAQQTIAAELEI